MAAKVADVFGPIPADVRALMNQGMDATAARMAASEHFSAFDAARFRANSRVAEPWTHQGRVATRLMAEDPRLSFETALKRAERLPAYEENGAMVLSGGTPPEYIPEIVQHEALHTLAGPGLRTAANMPFNEAVTQWFTNQLIGGEFVGVGYERHVNIIEEVFDSLGEVRVASAYKSGETGGLRALLDAQEAGLADTIFDKLDIAHGRAPSSASSKPAEVVAPTLPNTPTP